MLDMARSRGARIKWGLRALGRGLMWAGGALVLSFLPALASYVPLVGPLAASLAGVATAVASFGAALATSALVIAAAWTRFRPLHASALAAAAAALVAAQGTYLRRQSSQAAEQPLGRAHRGRIRMPHGARV